MNVPTCSGALLTSHIAFNKQAFPSSRCLKAIINYFFVGSLNTVIGSWIISDGLNLLVLLKILATFLMQNKPKFWKRL